MRFFTFVVLLVAVANVSAAQGNDGRPYHYTVNLANVVDDRVLVELFPPPVKDKTITFYLPKIVPGTYSVEDFGRFVSQLKAVDKKGRELPVERKDENTWSIRKARKIDRITYWLDDTWDTEMEGPDIFWPAGTNIEAGRNFVINSSGFFGYFNGLTETNFRISVVRPAQLYGTTGLIALESATAGDHVIDTYQAEDYDHLVDSPIMYAAADTAMIRVANTEVLIGSYSPNRKITAREIAASIREILMAQKEFLGGELPVDKYAFIFYFTDTPGDSYGALEHSTSSFYYLPEMPIGQINQELRDFAAHEFFHILTPLTIHSREISDFDYNNPAMSQHLWMYEGVPEYFSFLVQVQHDLISMDDFILTLREKMLIADEYLDNVPFTEISKFTLNKYHDQYDNVYQKGALIGLCLDLTLRNLSGGERGLRDLMLQLSRKYGKDKPFEDHALFDEIAAMTDPAIGKFFEHYVSGITDTTSSRYVDSLPFEELLDEVGIIYAQEHSFEDLSLGIDNNDLGLAHLEDVPMFQIATTAHLNEMGQALGFQEGDILLRIDGDNIPRLDSPDVGAFIHAKLTGLTEGEDLSYTVLRLNSNGERKETILRAPVRPVTITQRHLLAPNPNATHEQLALRRAWLSPN